MQSTRLRFIPLSAHLQLQEATVSVLPLSRALHCTLGMTPITLTGISSFVTVTAPTRQLHLLRTGVYTFWDKDNRQRLKNFPSANYPITATAFNAQGNLFAYCLGYDWSKGHQDNHAHVARKILIYRVQDEDVKPKPQNRTRR